MITDTVRLVGLVVGLVEALLIAAATVKSVRSPVARGGSRGW